MSCPPLPAAMRFTYLLHAPVPHDNGATQNLVSVPSIDSHRLRSYFAQRRQLGATVASLQQRLARGEGSEAEGGEMRAVAIASIEKATQLADEVYQKWSDLFGALMSLGSAVRVCGEFAPTWQLAAHSGVYECGERQLVNQTHTYPALVFEGAALCYLSAVLRQQFAALREPAVDRETASALDAALTRVATVEQRWLPLHFLTPGSRFAPPYLLAPQFYADYVRPLIVAQQQRHEALRASLERPTINSVSLLERSALSLFQAARAGFGDYRRLAGAATQRHAVAVASLAHLFLDGANGGDERLDERQISLEAVVCARAAAAILNDEPMIRELLAEAIDSAKRKHAFLFVDSDWSLDTPERRDVARRAVKLRVATTSTPTMRCVHACGAVGSAPDLSALHEYEI